MLQILALIILTSVAADISRRVHLSRAVFAQLSQPTSIARLVWLYPLPFLLPLFATSFFAFVLFQVPLGVLFFVPALMSARATRKCLELSGDGRVKPALAAVDMTTCVLALWASWQFSFSLFLYGYLDGKTQAA
jgi:hypothetical protein